MYKLDLVPDHKEAQAIERRRAQEEARKARVFNAKYRIIGVDPQVLERQVDDKRTKEVREHIRDEAFGRNHIIVENLRSYISFL